MTVRKKVF